MVEVVLERKEERVRRVEGGRMSRRARRLRGVNLGGGREGEGGVGTGLRGILGVRRGFRNRLIVLIL